MVCHGTLVPDFCPHTLQEEQCFLGYLTQTDID
jgi:hypothetical protein